MRRTSHLAGGRRLGPPLRRLCALRRRRGRRQEQAVRANERLPAPKGGGRRRCARGARRAESRVHVGRRRSEASPSPFPSLALHLIRSKRWLRQTFPAFSTNFRASKTPERAERREENNKTRAVDMSKAKASSSGGDRVVRERFPLSSPIAPQEAFARSRQKPPLALSFSFSIPTHLV